MPISESQNQEESHSYSINIAEISDDEVDMIKNKRLREVMKEIKKHDEKYKKELVDKSTPDVPGKSGFYAQITFVKSLPHAKSLHAKSPR